MVGWMLQWYANVPAVPNTWENVAAEANGPEPKLPSSAVTVCVDGPLFRHVTVSPT
jgi:hypothetical protein